MRPIEVARHYPHSPERVWAALSDVAAHVTWMKDAERIEFASEARRGVGTAFTCVTRVGPLRTSDRMVVTAWEEGAEIAVTHRGLVTGSGRFTLAPVGSGTRLTWREDLTLPWWFGGRLGGLVARSILTRLWRGNLDRFGTALG